MGFRPKNEPNDPYGHPNDLGILLIPKWPNPFLFDSDLIQISISIQISSKLVYLNLDPIQDHFVNSSVTPQNSGACHPSTREMHVDIVTPQNLGVC